MKNLGNLNGQLFIRPILIGHSFLELKNYLNRIVI